MTASALLLQVGTPHLRLCQIVSSKNTAEARIMISGSQSHSQRTWMYDCSSDAVPRTAAVDLRRMLFVMLVAMLRIVSGIWSGPLWNKEPMMSLEKPERALPRSPLGARKGITDDPLDAVRRVEADLRGHLLRRTCPHPSAVADVRTLGALADHDEVDVARIGQRRRYAGVDPRRPQVDVVV